MTLYDEVEYQSYPYSETHPSKLFALAQLFAMRAVEPRQMRLLEIACGAGGNLLPLAAEYPEAQLVGIDLSAVAIAQAETLRSAAGLTNVELRTADLSTVDESYGAFDYIIAHGVYSWVPPPVRERLLDVIAARLAPSGIAFVSHNVLPGCAARGVARELMRFSSRRQPDHAARIERARAILAFSVDNMRDERYREMMRGQLESIASMPDWYLFHDYLADHYFAEHFYEMVERIEARGLQFLADARFSSLFGTGFSDEANRTIDGLSRDLIEVEQYRDFLRNRAFRETLICHRAQPLRRDLGGERLANLYVASRAKPTWPGPIPLDDDRAVQFMTPDGRSEVTAPFDKAMMVTLVEAWPRFLSQRELGEAAAALTPPAWVPTNPVEMVAENLLRLATAELCSLRWDRPQLVTALSERPVVAPFARAQIALAPAVANRHHDLYKMRGKDRALMGLLDGTRTLAEVALELGVDLSEVQTTVAAYGKAALLTG